MNSKCGLLWFLLCLHMCHPWLLSFFSWWLTSSVRCSITNLKCYSHQKLENHSAAQLVVSLRASPRLIGEKACGWRKLFMGIICSTAIELGLTVGKRICNKGIYIFGKVARSELPIMLCLKSWSFLCIYRKLNLEFPVLAYALEMIFQPFVSSILASFYLTLSGFLLPLIVSMSC